MSYLAVHHLAVIDPSTGGWTAPGMGLLLPTTNGWDYPHRSGGVALLRRQLYPTVGIWQYCGVAQGDDTQISNYPGLTHTAEQGYQYTAVRILGNGMISVMAEPYRIDFDAEGSRIVPPLPVWPINLAVAAIAAGKIRVRWEYDPYGQGAGPADFQVFEGADAGSVDYETPLTDSVTGLNYVSYSGGRRVFSFTTGAFDDWSAHVFGVRGRNSEGVAELNTNVTESVTARAAAPTAAPAPLRIHVDPLSRVGA